MEYTNVIKGTPSQVMAVIEDLVYQEDHGRWGKHGEEWDETNDEQ